MKRFAMPTVCCLVLGLGAVLAQHPDSQDDAQLRQVEKRIRIALSDLDEGLVFEYSESSRSLFVNYRTREFMVHGQSRGGEYSKQAHETVGPSYKGFRLRLSLQDAGAVNAAFVPQTIREPYWKTYLDVRLLEGTNKQLFCGLSYGSRVEQDLLKRLRKILNDLGEAPYLKHRQPSKR